MNNLEISLPEKFKPFLTSHTRYKCAVGGRGGAKTYSFAIIFLILALSKKIKVLCCREIMRSVKDSVYEVILLTIRRYNLENYFSITQTEIICNITGSKFIFSGLFRNIEKIKSIPELTHVWGNECDKFSEESIQLLFPTVREQGSEIFLEWNPGYPDDPVQKRFIENPPNNSLVVHVGWQDNPYISQTLLDEKDTDYAQRPEEAKHIWGGELKNYGANVWSPPFDKSVHVREFDLRTIKDYKIFQALDPHTSFYSASIWAARWKTGDHFTTWIYDEWPRFSTLNAYYSDIRKKLHYKGSVEDLSRAFFAAETGIQVTERYIDTRYSKGFGSAQSNLINNTRGLVEDFADPKNGGILFKLPQERNIDRANDIIKADLRYNTIQGLSDINKPKLYVSASCKNTLRALTLHRYEEDQEKEMETYKDFSDCITILTAGIGEYRWPGKRKSIDSNRRGGGSWMGT